MFSRAINAMITSETIQISPEHLRKRYESVFSGKIVKLINYI